MVKHIILWTLNPELTVEKKEQVKREIKTGLESLQGKIDGLVSIKVNIDGRLDSSNCDVMLDSTLESPAALKAYATHPAHVTVADTKIRPYTVQRVCLDFEE
ncbi:MAG: Dabb family protein [Alloprevotella sp.]|nr:Dabb family protein [Bacteroidales bacterium]MDY3732711.1 Dabb family protein [Alloprevotella sp.]